MVSTSVLSMGVYGHLRSARAANDCGVIASGGTAVCTLTGNPYTTGIDYDVDDATIVLEDGVIVSTTTDNTSGVESGASAPFGDLAVTTEGTVAITTTGDNSNGISVETDDGTVTIDTSTGTTIRTEGEDAVAIRAYNRDAHDISITANGAITTTGASSAGVLARNYGTGDITITTDTITLADTGTGIAVFTPEGTVTITTSGISATNGSGISVFLGTGAVDITSTGAVTTAGQAVRVGTNSGDITIDTQGLVSSTSTDPTVYANSLGGDILVTTNGVSAANGTGIAGWTQSTGTVDITAAGPITSARRAIDARTADGDITIDAQDQVTVSGTYEAVYARSDSGNVAITTNGVSSLNGYGIVAAGGTGTIDITATGATTTADAAIIAVASSGDITIDAQDQLTTSSANPALFAYSNSGAVSITTSGVSSALGSGIDARTVYGDITITDSSTIDAAQFGILAQSTEGNIDVTAGEVTSTSGTGVFALTGGSSSVTVSGDLTASITGVVAYGATGATVTTQGDVTSGGTGVLAQAASGAVSVTTLGDVTADSTGVAAISLTGPLTVSVNNVTSRANEGAIHVSSGSTVEINVAGDVLSDAAGGGGLGAGIQIENSTTSTINIEDSGTVGAMSDLAIYDAGGGAMTINNEGTITGSMLLSDFDDALNNLSSNSVNLRRFVDTDADGIRDTEAVAILDFGAGNDTFNNAATGALRLSTVTGATAFDTTGETFATGSAGLSLTNEGIEQGHLLELETFINSGLISMADADTGGTGPVAGDILVITSLTAPGTGGTSNFISNGGELHLDTQLDDGAVDTTDVLILDTTTTGAGGATGITVTNAGGAGGITGTGATDGILVVEVQGATSDSDAFELSRAVVGGIYEYELNQADGQNWYLQSSGAFATQIAAYRAMPLALSGFARDQMPWAQQRWGHLDATSAVRSGAWMRGGYVGGEAETGTAEDYETHDRFAQGGYDFAVNTGGAGNLSLGGMLEYASTDTEMQGGNASAFNATGYGAGMSAFWSTGGGTFVEAVATLNQWDIEVDRPLLSDVANTDALTYGIGMQVGHQVDLSGETDRWTVTPRASVTYIESDIDSFTDATGMLVDFTDSDSMLLEAGMISGLDLDLKGNRVLSLSAELGIEHEVGGTMSFTGNTTSFSAERADTRASYGAGAALRLGDDFSLFARASGASALSGSGHTAEASVGLRITF